MSTDMSFAVSERWLSRLGTKWLGLSSDRRERIEIKPYRNQVSGNDDHTPFAWFGFDGFDMSFGLLNPMDNFHYRTLFEYDFLGYSR
ncbi:hypothetical protein H8E77_31955 [bacterium]|nr:hypothetical protein [bacterium]